MIPSELRGAIPREVRVTRHGIAVIVIAIVMMVGALAAAIVLTIAHTRGRTQQELIAREGTLAQAEVVQVAIDRGDKPHRTVTYRFDVNGRSYIGSTRLRERDPRVAERGGLVPVEYVASRPTSNWVSGYAPGFPPAWMIPLIPLSLLGAAFATTRTLRLQWILLSEGRAADGLVTDSKRVRKDERRVYRVGYEFRELSGAMRRGSYEVGKNPPPIGTVVPILYHRENSKWSAVYPLLLVKTSRSPLSERGRRPRPRLGASNPSTANWSG